MMRRYAQLMVGLCIISTLTACGTYSSIEAPATTPQMSTPVAAKAQEEEVPYTQIDDVQFKRFFDDYFSLSQDDILLLNQNPMKVGEDYWKIYEAKDKVFKEVFYKYMSDDLKKQMKEQYVLNVFQVPKLLEMNQYVTDGLVRVEEVKVLSVKPLGDNIIYEVAVKTKNKVVDIATANKKYVWSKNLRYYVTGQKSNPLMPAFSTVQNIEGELKDSYMFLQETPETVEDEIRLKHHYWIEAKKEDKLKICSLTEANPMGSQEEFRQKACNNKYVTRIPYWDDAPENASKTAKKVLLKVLSQPLDFFSYYEKILNTDSEGLYTLFKMDLKLGNEVIVPKAYKEAYSPKINPYKDNVAKLSIDEKKVKVEVSIYATAKQPRFNITVPAEVLLNDNNVVYYNYDYLVGLEQDKVEFIHFVKVEEVQSETEGSNTAEETQNAAETQNVAGTQDAVGTQNGQEAKEAN